MFKIYKESKIDTNINGNLIYLYERSSLGKCLFYPCLICWHVIHLLVLLSLCCSIFPYEHHCLANPGVVASNPLRSFQSTRSSGGQWQWQRENQWHGRCTTSAPHWIVLSMMQSTSKKKVLPLFLWGQKKTPLLLEFWMSIIPILNS